MADGLELKRIVDLVAQTDIDEGVYTIIDSVSGAVKKYPLGSFICSVAPIFDATAAYAAGAYCNYNGQLYQFDEAHAAGAWTGEDATAVTLSQILGENGEDISDLQGDVSSLQTDMAGKADANGNYPNMTAGNADQLVSSVKIEDQVPYQFRTSGGSADIGDREYDKIVGGTIAWNQLVEDGNFTGTSKWKTENGTMSVANNVATLTPTFSSGGFSSISGDRVQMNAKAIPGHKCLMMVDVKSSAWAETGNAVVVTIAGLWFKTVDASNLNVNGWNTLFAIKTIPDSATYIFPIVRKYYESTMGDLEVRNFVCYDLTAMFGSAITSYIGDLEYATVGAGVAWFKKLFPKPYYAYDAGTLKSVEGLDSHDMTGFNQWDEEWESGYINVSNGLPVPDAGKIRMKNYMPVIPNTTYYKKSPDAFWNVYFDADKNYIGYGDAGVNTTFTTPANAYYIRSGFETVYGTTYNHDICINLHWDGERDGEYEPYELHSYALDDSLTLRGIPKLDANNALYYDGDTYEADGTVTRRYGIVDLGTLEWTKDTSGTYARFAAEDNQLANKWKPTDTYVRANGLFCTQYVPDRLAAGGGVDKGISGYQGSTSIYISDSVYASSTADQFKTAMSGVYLVYELDTPTTETAEPYQSPQIVDDFGTEEYVTTSIVPVGHNTQYANNLRAKLEMAPNSPDGNGDYIVRQTDGINEYVELVIPSELPAAPTTDGNYKLRVSVSGGTATYSWVADS